MPKIAEIRLIDNEPWARLVTDDGLIDTHIKILSDDEITANAEKWEALLAENERLKEALASCCCCAGRAAVPE